MVNYENRYEEIVRLKSACKGMNGTVKDVSYKGIFNSLGCNEQLDCDDNSLIPININKCKSIRTVCDDGVIISSEKICNRIFDCLDLSDERSCNPASVKPAKEDCLLICDETCIPIHKICNHITDCNDGSDEIICGHESYCSSKWLKLCNDYIICYNSSSECDGYADCMDKSDEIYCPEIIPKCVNEDIFTCDNGQQICISRACDSTYDCTDFSDEGYKCWFTKRVKKISIQMLSDGRALISWYIDGTYKPEYEIIVREYDSNHTIFSTTTKNKHITVHNHVNCHRYYVKVTTKNSIHRSLTYIYRALHTISIPFNLKYDDFNHVLSWNIDRPYCVPRTFYIECIGSDSIKRVNFSQYPNYIILFPKTETCKVSCCLLASFNTSCSPFSEEIIITVSIAKLQTSEIRYALLFFTIIYVLIIVIRLFKKAKIAEWQFIKTCLSWSLKILLHNKYIVTRKKMSYVI